MKVTWENAENGEIIGREKAKHTPGPWKHDPYWSLIMAGQSEIAAVHAAIQAGEKRKRLDEAQANARLIAAAPDLLEACKAAVEYIYETEPADGKLSDAGRLIQSLNAAIQKAERAS